MLFAPRLLNLQPLWAPGEGGGGSTGDQNPGSSTTDDNQSGKDTYTKDEVADLVKSAVHSAIEDRMAREASTRSKKIEEARSAAVKEFRDRYGLDDDRIKKLDEQTSELDKVRRKASDLEREAAEARAAAETERKKRLEYVVGDALKSAALKAGAIPGAVDQLARLLGDRVRLDDKDAVQVLDKYGEPSTDTVDDLVGGYLSDNEHFKAPANSSGGGGGQGGGSRGGKSKPETPDEVFSRLRDEARAARSK